MATATKAKKKKPKSKPVATKASTPAKPRPEKNGIGKVMRLAVALIECIRPFQMRIGLDLDHVDELIEAIRAGKELPLMTVYHLPDGRYVVTDGHHRCTAYDRAGIEYVSCRVIEGTEFEAKLASAAANRDHGLKRTGEDKLRAFKCITLTLREAKVAWSNRKIADHIGVSPDYVDRHSNDGLLPESGTPKVGADGRVLGEKHKAPVRCTLPPAIQSIPSAQLKCVPRIGEQLAKSGVTTSGEFFVRFKSGDLMGLERRDIEEVQGSIRTEGMRLAAAREPEVLSKANIRPIALRFERTVIEKTACWLREETRQDGKLRIALPDPLEVIVAAAEIMGDDKIYSALIACEEMFKGSKEGTAFFSAIGLAEEKTEEKPPIAAAEPKEPANAKAKPLLPAPLFSMIHLPADGVTKLSALPGFTAKVEAILAQQKIETVKELLGTITKRNPLFISHEALLKSLDEVIAAKTGIEAESWDVSNASEAIVTHLRASAFLPTEACAIMAEGFDRVVTSATNSKDVVTSATNSKDDKPPPKIGHMLLNMRPHLVLSERHAGGSVAYFLRPLWTEQEAKSQGIAPMAPGDPMEGAKVQIKLPGVGAVYWSERIIGSKQQEKRFVHLPRSKKKAVGA